MAMCRLECKSGKKFEVEVEVIKKSVIIKSMLDDLAGGGDETGGDDDVIPLPNITEHSLEKIIEWCQQHRNDPPPPEGEDGFSFNDQIDEWDREFLRMDDGALFDLILAANYLDIKGLLDVTTTHVALMIVEARTPEEIRKRFNIKNDLTPEDLERIKKEAATWLDDDDDDGEDDDKPDERESRQRSSASARQETASGSQAAARMDDS